VLLLLELLCHPTFAATQVGSAPYHASATGAGNSHSPVFSADGKHVAFVSQANNLVTNDDLAPHLDLFLRDLVTSNTVLVSMSTNGFGGANDNIGLYTLSSNAQVVAFDTAASNLLPWDNNRVSDIYVQDLLFGGRLRVTWSAGDDGDGNANGPSYNPLISEDGRYIIFESLASNLVTNDFNGTNDIFIHDLMTGITELVSVNADGTASPDGPSYSPSISANGLFVAFASRATNLVIGVTNVLDEIYVRDIAGASNHWAQAAHLSGTHSRAQASGALESYRASEPVLSADGRFVVFKTLGQTVRFDLQRPTNTVIQFFPPSPEIGALSNYFRFDDNPRLATSTSEGPLWFGSNGRFAVYGTRTNVVPQPGVLLVDFEVFATNVIHITGDGTASNYWFTNQVPWAKMVLTNAGVPIPQLGKTWNQMPWLAASADASRVLFLADATNLVSVVTNRTFQLYSLGVADGAIQLVSTNSSGGPCLDLNGIVPAHSPDGSLIAWDSLDDNIVADDLNRAWDVFVRNVDTGETQLVSARHPNLPMTSGIALSRLDLNPGAISANGQRLAILSLDNTLALDDTNNWRDLFVRDLVTGTNIDVSRSIGRVPFSQQTNFPGTNTAAAPFLSADGRFVAFAGDALFFAQSTNRTIYWRDLQALSNRVVVAGSQNNPAGVSYPVLSSSGRLLAFHSSDIHDLYYGDGNGQSDVFVRLMTPNPPRLDCSFLPFLFAPVFISVAEGTTTTANGPSINPAFSPDSAWILFQSRAANLLSDPIPAQSTYQLYARGVGITTLVTNACGPVDMLTYTPTRWISYSTTASPGPNGISTDLPLPGGGANPRFSADSRYVAFESSPNLIYRHDLLNAWVIKTITHPDPMYPSLTNRARFTNDLVCSNCANPTLNADGSYIAYETRRATNVPNDIFVKDLQTGEDQLISVNSAGTAGGNGSSSTPLISHDARFVVFASKASDLVPGDSNRATDIFVRDRLNHVTHCLSRNGSGTGTGNRVSSNPILSADGRTVAFQSFASDLVPGDYNDTRDVFVVTLGGPDTDSDGMDDDWEMAYFSTLSRDGSGDFDNDGSSDLAEFRAGTNPANDASILRVLTISTVHRSPSELSQATLVWSAAPGRTYRVQFKDNVAGTTWMDVPGDVVAASTSASKTYTPAYYTGYFTTHRFYRVLLVQ
jgi:Tol biopolymer transport system component